MKNPIKRFFEKRLLREHGIKLALDTATLGRSTLLIENFASLSQTQISSALVKIGAYSYLRSACELQNIDNIGRFCSIGNQAILGQERSGHPMDWVSTHPFQHTICKITYDHTLAPATIGHDVWIGRGAVIMEGVSIGTGAVIGMRSIVTHDIPPYAIAAGSPARVIRYRHSPELIARLLASQWWELPMDFLQQAPLNEPQRFVAHLEQHARPVAADHRLVQVTRHGVCRMPHSRPES